MPAHSSHSINIRLARVNVASSIPLLFGDLVRTRPIAARSAELSAIVNFWPSEESKAAFANRVRCCRKQPSRLEGVISSEGIECHIAEAVGWTAVGFIPVAQPLKRASSLRLPAHPAIAAAADMAFLLQSTVHCRSASSCPEAPNHDLMPSCSGGTGRVVAGR